MKRVAEEEEEPKAEAETFILASFPIVSIMLSSTYSPAQQQHIALVSEKDVGTRTSEAQAQKF